MPCTEASCLKSFDRVSVPLRSGTLVLSVDTDMDGACLRMGLLVLEMRVSLVVTVCFSVRRSRSSADRMLFVRGLPDSALLCSSRSWLSPGLGDAFPAPAAVLCALASNGDRVVVLLLLSVPVLVFMRGARDVVAFSPAAAPFVPLAAPWAEFLVVDADMFSGYIWRRGRVAFLVVSGRMCWAGLFLGRERGLGEQVSAEGM